MSLAGGLSGSLNHCGWSRRRADGGKAGFERSCLWADRWSLLGVVSVEDAALIKLVAVDIRIEVSLEVSLSR